MTVDPAERAAKREDTITKVMVKNKVDHDTAEAQVTVLAITSGFKSATDGELFEWMVKAGWAKPEDRKSTDTKEKK